MIYGRMFHSICIQVCREVKEGLFSTDVAHNRLRFYGLGIMDNLDDSRAHLAHPVSETFVLFIIE